MKKIAFVVAAASLFAFAPLAHRFGPLIASISIVWMGILLALFASGLSLYGASLAIGTGALVQREWPEADVHGDRSAKACETKRILISSQRL